MLNKNDDKQYKKVTTKSPPLLSSKNDDSNQVHLHLEQQYSLYIKDIFNLRFSEKG